MLGCRDAAPLTAGSSATFQQSRQAAQAGTPLLEMSYEVESTTRIFAEQSSHATADLITEIPQIDRQRVSMSLSTDGSSAWVIEQLPPSQDIVPNHESLPNHTPVPTKIIWAQGELSLYDEEGNFMQSHPAEMPNLSALAAEVQQAQGEWGTAEINQAILAAQTSGFDQALKDLLANPAAQGVGVTELEGGVVSLTFPLDQTDLVQAQDGYEAVVLVDTLRNLMLAHRLYDAEGQVKSSTMLEYDASTTHPYLKGILHQASDVLPSGQAAMMETYSRIENLSITLN